MKPTVEQVLASQSPLAFDTEFDGACPCSNFEGQGFEVFVHCWRSHPCCAYSGIHITGDLKTYVALELARHIALYSGWAVPFPDHTVIVGWDFVEGQTHFALKTTAAED